MTLRFKKVYAIFAINLQLEFPILECINSVSLSAIFVVQSALAMIFLAKGDFAFVSGAAALPSP